MSNYGNFMYGAYGADVDETDPRQNTLKACVMFCMLSTLSSDADAFVNETMEYSFVGKVLKRKMECMNCSIEISDTVYILLDICSGSNPGLSQIMLHDLLETARKRGYEKIDFTEFSLIHASEFPIVLKDNGDYTEYGLEISRKWDEQKVHPEKGLSYNKVDTKEYWQEVFGEVKA